MILAKEITAPFTVDATEMDRPLFARIDITKQSDAKKFLALDHGNKTPLLFLPSLNVHVTRMDDNFCTNIIDQHTTVVQELLMQGTKRFTLAIDNDGALQKLISPRFRPADLMLRAQPLFNLFETLTKLTKAIDIILTVEELSPGGLDATDGVMIARELERRGLAHAIATAGTRDFPQLFDRRVTQKKQETAEDFISNEPALASAQWLLNHTTLPVSCCAYFDDLPSATAMAKQLGLVALIEKA